MTDFDPSDYTPHDTKAPTPDPHDPIYYHVSQKEAEALANKIKRSYGSLVDFRKEMIVDTPKHEYASPQFHYDWSDILLYGAKHFNIQAHRQSAKSSYVIRAFPLYRLMFPSRETRYMCLIKRNQDVAGGKLKEIEREYRSNPYLKQNLVRIVEESAEAFQVVVVDPLTGEDIEVRIEAHGKGPTLRGALWGDLRPQILIVDDIQTKDDMDSEKIMKRDWQWFLDDVLFLSTYGRIFMISNNLGESCVSERIFNTEGHFNFTCVKVPRTSELTENGTPAWPSKETQAQILEEYERYKAAHEESIWIRNCMCECIGDQDKVFFRDQFQYYPLATLQNIIKDCNVYIRMDTAVKDKDTSDYTAIVVFGINPDNHTFIFDISYGHYSTDKKQDELFRLVTKWRPNNVGIEETNESYQLIKDIRKEMPRRKAFFQLHSLKHCGRRKEVRIETTLQPRYAAQTMWHPESAPWLRELEHELLMFSRTGRTSLKDDIIDALAYMGQETAVPMRRHNNINDKEIQVAKCEINVY